MYKKKLHSLNILIPAYNEKNNLKKFLISLKKKFKVLIIDDGSNDGTKEYLKKNKINFLRNQKNKGYEKSLLKGFSHLIKKNNIKHILTMDADGQHRISSIDKIYTQIIKNDLDLVIGLRSKKNRIIEKIISFFFYLKYNLADPLSGFKIYKKEKLKEINLKKVKNLFLLDLIIICKNKNFNIKNFKIKTSIRIDKPRIGNFLNSYFKMFKILFYLLLLKKHNDK